MASGGATGAYLNQLLSCFARTKLTVGLELAHIAVEVTEA